LNDSGTFSEDVALNHDVEASENHGSVDVIPDLGSFTGQPLSAAGSTESAQIPLEQGSVAPPLTLWQQIREDWIAHGCDWTKPGFRAVAIQRFGVWRMMIEPLFLRAPFSLLYRALYRKARNTYGIDLPYTVKLGRRVIIEHQSAIIIHGDAVIGDDCILRQGVTLGNRYLDRPLEAPVLGDRVNVGAGAKILGKVTIGDDANIGANAVVLSDVPAGRSAVGIPAKLLPEKSS
jgi:serine O-acetyltransferase